MFGALGAASMLGQARLPPEGVLVDVDLRLRVSLRVSLTRRPVTVVLRDSDARPMTLADLVVFAHFDVDK